MSWWGRLVAAIRQWLGLDPRPVLRDVTRLAGEDAPLGATVEQVRTSGPLKAGGRRMILRDPRLLPKPPRKWTPKKPPPLMAKEDAGRRFAATLRTRQRAIGDLLADEAQLTRLGLPLWRDEASLAAALELTPRQLRAFTVHRAMERQPHYVVFAIPKRTGGERLIHAPKRRLKAVLRRLDAALVRRLPVHDAAHGFVAKRGVATHAALHVGKAVVVRIDLKDFFHQVTFARLRGFFLHCGYSYPVAATLAALCTEPDRQPVEVDGAVVYAPVSPRRCVQGAPTSPGLCNAIAGKLDRRLAGLAAKWGLTYSRYADDLVFSGEIAPDRLVAAVTRICGEEGFPVNPAKTRVMRKGRAQRVTGATVNTVLGLSRKERRKIRAAAHRQAERARVVGRIAWVNALNPEQARRLKLRLR